jgi:hypothetical protein
VSGRADNVPVGSPSAAQADTAVALTLAQTTLSLLVGEPPLARAIFHTRKTKDKATVRRVLALPTKAQPTDAGTADQFGDPSPKLEDTSLVLSGARSEGRRTPGCGLKKSIELDGRHCCMRSRDKQCFTLFDQIARPHGSFISPLAVFRRRWREALIPYAHRAGVAKHRTGELQRGAAQVRIYQRLISITGMDGAKLLVSITRRVDQRLQAWHHGRRPGLGSRSCDRRTITIVNHRRASTAGLHHLKRIR